ncbi:hypothetical protein FQA39_LY07892 [Lamprigera yunnana]|nr:hypothetical protein FQA39_LY07892 [Lamprigera yunnana]
MQFLYATHSVCKTHTMKALILIFCAFIASSQQLDFKKITADFEGAIDENARDCYKENNLTRNQLDEAISSLRLPNDRSIICFFDCVANHLNIVDKAGKIVEDIFKAYLYVDDDGLKDKIYRECKDLKGDGECEKIYNISQCAIDENARDCYKENNLTRKQLDELISSLRLPNDRSIKCFFDCVLTHLNIVDKLGNLVEDNFKAYLFVDDDGLKNQIYNACKDFKGDDECERIYNVSECVRKNLLKNSD